MREPTREEMKKALMAWKNAYVLNTDEPEGTYRMFKAICRALIEHGPEVSRKRISQLLAQRPSWDTEVCIMQYLRECGVTVKEG